MGPLKGIKILEFSGIGPGPYCGMLLADMGADVIRVGRKGTEGVENKYDIHNDIFQLIFEGNLYYFDHKWMV